MTKAMMVRLSLVAIVVLGLIGFALQAIDPTSSTTAVEAAATRSAPFDDSAPTQDRDGARQYDPAALTHTSAARQSNDDGMVTLTLLHNNDGESKLLPDAEAGFPGIARFAQTWVDLGRATDADILLRVSAGDNFLASKEFASGLARDGQPLYDSLALRGLYEAMGLGNHDFDFGPDVTARFIEGFRLNENSQPVPFLAANLDVSAEPALQALADEGRIAPSMVFTDPTSGLDVGVIGAITPRLPNISSPRNVVVDPDVAGAINAQVESLEAQGVDRIILVSHLQGLSEDRALVPELRGVDIVVAGGGDELLKNSGSTCLPDEDAVDDYPLLLSDADGIEIPVVTAPGGYRCIGQLDVTFDEDGAVSDFEGVSIGVPLDGNAEDFALARVEEPLTDAVAELEATIIGSSTVALDGRRNSVRTASSNVGELLADALLAAGQAAPDFGGPAPIVAVQNGGGIRNDAVIPARDITEADTFDIAPFANFVVTGEVPRDQFKELLEVGVAGLPDAEGTFPQIAGFAMEIDVGEPARQVATDGDCGRTGDPGSRVRTVTLDDGTEIVRDGRVVAGDDIALATIDFLAGGGDCYPLDDIDFTKVGASYQQALSSYIVDGLDGAITGDDYPEGGSRTAIENVDAIADPQDDADDTRDDSDGEAAANAENTEDTEDTEETEETQDADETADGELPNTGLDSWLFIIVALTVAAAGALIAFEAQRAGWLSLRTRLAATRAWMPDTHSNDD